MSRRTFLSLVLAVAVPVLSVPVPGAADVFLDRAAEVGIDFVHFNGMSGELYFPEMTGAGAALFDYDGDGDLDAYLAQGNMMGDKPVDSATFPPKHPLPLVGRLYRNDLEVRPDGTRVLKFTDVTDESGLASSGYGMGVAVGDYDNDGCPDLYTANFGPNQLFHNECDGTFTDVTEKSGTDDPRWSVPAVFFDYDGDGWLDLYVGNYVDFRIATHKTCTTVAGIPDYCGPRSYAAVSDRLFRNRGDGTFADVTSKVGIDKEYGAALGSVVSDFDGDGDLDLYVANDGSANQLWLTQGDGKFENGALLGGCAVNEDGQPQASMGVIAADFDGNGADDLFMTHVDQETNTLYLNDGTGLFEDRSQESGLGIPSWSATGFGTAAIDYDNDGWIDVFVANGAVTFREEQARAGDPYPLKEKNLLFHNRGNGRFEDVSAQAGKVLELMEVSRGLALGDVDNDGDSDLLLSNNAGPARLLMNQVGQDRAWIGLRLVDESGKRDVVGALVQVFPKGGSPLARRNRTDGSYASASDPRVLVGLGDAEAVEKVRVTWPGGRREEWTGVPIREYTTLEKGSGRAITE